MRECSEGKNFSLDPEDRQFRNRKPFDLIGTLPNASEVRGMACLLKTDGTVSCLVQGGDTVYEWDGATTFTSVGSVDANAKLRGRIEHNWQLDDVVIITDINLQEEVLQWDGTTLSAISFTKDSGPEVPFGTFRAKYCSISDERAFYANVHDNGTDTNHLIVGSKRSDYKNISTADRASSALSDADPFFLIHPDYRPINGLVEAFGKVVTSSEKGSMFELLGGSASDFQFDELFPRSGASGAESLVHAGNDLFYGRSGRIESLLDTEKAGDVETNDVSVSIGDLIDQFDSWTSAYNARNQRVYFFPSDQNEVFVLHKSIRDAFKFGGEALSPWSRWTTNHSSSFQQTAVMNMLDPVDGLEYVFFGDASGNFYRLEGSGDAGDAGSTEVEVERLSGLLKAPQGQELTEIRGYVLYRTGLASEITLNFEFSGSSVSNESITVTLPGISNRTVYSGSAYYGEGFYYGAAFEGRLKREIFGVAGRSTEFQVRTTVEGVEDFIVTEIGLRFASVA